MKNILHQHPALFGPETWLLAVVATLFLLAGEFLGVIY